MPPKLYLIHSSDPTIRAITTVPDGGNIPADEQLSFWADVVTLIDTRDLRYHVPDASLAFMDLELRGFHLYRATAQVLNFRPKSDSKKPQTLVSEPETKAPGTHRVPL
jgi:hypothetical protein